MSQAFIDVVLSRQSEKFLQAPGPDAAQLDLILQAAMRAPDHGAIRPWRFALVRGENIPRLVDIGVQAGEAAQAPLKDHKISTARRWLAKVPLVIAIAAAADPRGKIPMHECRSSTAAAVMNMLNAAHALGFHGYWSTGIGTYLDGVAEALGFDALETEFMGYLALGTPIETPVAKTRPDYRDHVREWQGPSVL